MNPWIIYLLGFITLPLATGLWLAIRAALDSEYGSTCDHCGKVFGIENKTWAIVSDARWRVHYLKYWYRTRPEWTCTLTNETGTP